MKILFKPSFVRQYSKLSKELQQEAKEKIELFRHDQNHQFLKTHKLKGKLKSFWSFSVNYSYRVIFTYLKKDEVVLHAIGDHDVYT